MSRAPSIALILIYVCLSLTPIWTAARGPVSDNGRITDKLVAFIQKKKYDDFVKELAVPDMDVNQPSPRGQLPLVEAVKIKDLQFVDVLIQYGAQVVVKEPGSEASPILLAFQDEAVDISRMLLAYGANPDVADKSGKKAIDVAPESAAIKELYNSWEKDGAMAFEDPPGEWLKKEDGDEGTEYWLNKKTNHSRWNMPPSCAWQRVEVMSGPPQYINYVTNQTSYKTPAALSWRKIRKEGQEVWYNYAANISQFEDPDEMPQYLVDEAASVINVRWFNSKTHEYSWEDPKIKSHWKTITEDGETQPYYYNIVTGASQWDLPDELAWSKHEHEDSFFWFNKETGENTWDLPVHESWERHDSDL